MAGVVGGCLTGSLAAGDADEYADGDLTVVVDEPDPDRLAAALVPDEASVQRRDPIEKLSFDWSGGHLDVDVVRTDDLRASEWDLPTRWEYDNAEVLVDPGGRVAARLADEVPFADGERASPVADRVEDLLFVGQWDVQTACLREDYATAHRAVSMATGAADALLFLREGAFVPREKWLVPEQEALSGVDDDVRSLHWEAAGVVERTPQDDPRRVVSLRTLHRQLRPSLVADGLVDPRNILINNVAISL